MKGKREMFTPKKTIPSLAVAMLALTGCGGDGNTGTGGSGASGGSGGSGGSDGNGLAAALQAFCMKAVECFPGYTLQDCVNYYNSQIAMYDVTPACEAAATSYFNCGAALSCAELDMYNNSCDDEFDAIFNVCMPLM
ncbi:MAG: hypothetical protein WBM46_05245 [Polyangiales bacterium]